MSAATLPLTDARWTALAERDIQHDGLFVYAVRTTGVYCRPSCGARTPNRENVVLFGDPAGAEEAGFRACRRCCPASGPSEPEARIARARTLIDTWLAEDAARKVVLGELAAAVGWSAGHLQRTFARVVGLSPRAYADAQRTARARAALQGGDTVLAATLDAGFGSGSALYDRAPDALGMSPGTFRRGGAGLRIRYALFDTALGVALVAATPRGVCAVSLGDDAAALVDALRSDFHAADLARDDGAIGPWAEPVLRALVGAPGDERTDAAQALLAVPVEVQGTAFQRRVWAALREIPVGETRTYGEVAAQIGRPTASRAVAQACGANRLALVVPCHRVVGAGGELRGYRWGPDRKRRLLEREK